MSPRRGLTISATLVIRKDNQVDSQHKTAAFEFIAGQLLVVRHFLGTDNTKEPQDKGKKGNHQDDRECDQGLQGPTGWQNLSLCV